MTRAILLALAIVGASPAHGQGEQAPPAPRPGSPAAESLDPAAVTAARDMLTATDFNTQLEQAAHLGAQATFTTMLAQLEEQSGFDFPDDLERDLRAILVEHMEGYVEAIRPTALEDAARIYARYFTAEEIRELQRLQTSPVMVKFNRIAPQFMAELMQVGMATELERTAELERRMAEAVEAWAVRNERYGQPPSS